MGGRPVRIPIEPEVYDLIFTEGERDGLWPVNPDRNVQNRRGIYLYQQAQRAPAPAHRLRPAGCHYFLPGPPCIHARAAGPGAVQLRLHAGSLAGIRGAARKILRAEPRMPDRSGLAARARSASAHAGGRASRGSFSSPAARCRISVWPCSTAMSSSMSRDCPHSPRQSNAPRRSGARRARLRLAGAGVAAVRRPTARTASIRSPPKPPHFPGKAKSVIFLFMVGGPSQVDTFDPKPALEKYNGQPLPASYGTIVSQFTKGDTPLLRSPWTFKKYGQCGRDVSTLFPHIAECVDDLCFVRSFYTDSTVHAPAMYQVNTGRILMGYPSMGSWITYGLGSESENLPAYVVMPQPEGTPEGGTPCWGAGFLPAVYQGTVFRSGASPILNLRPPERHDAAAPAPHARLSAKDERDGHARRRYAKWPRASAPTSWHSGCRAPPRKRWTCRRKPTATRKLYGLDQKRTQRIRHPLSAGPAAGGARRALHPAVFRRRAGLGAMGRSQRPGRQPREDVRHDGPSGRRPVDRI